MTEARPPASVILEDGDIALFITHYEAITEITERYERELEKKEQNPGVVMSRGQVEIRRYLKERGIEPRPFMRKAGKIIRGWLGLRILRDPSISDKRPAESHLRPLSADERKIIERHFDELTAVLKDIPTGY